MGIIKIVVDGHEREYITSLDDDAIEYKSKIDKKNYNMFEDTIEMKNLFDDVMKNNESSEKDG